MHYLAGTVLLAQPYMYCPTCATLHAQHIMPGITCTALHALVSLTAMHLPTFVKISIVFARLLGAL